MIATIVENHRSISPAGGGQRRDKDHHVDDDDLVGGERMQPLPAQLQQPIPADHHEQAARIAAGANWQMAIWIVVTTSSAQHTTKHAAAAPISPMTIERVVAGWRVIPSPACASSRAIARRSRVRME